MIPLALAISCVAGPLVLASAAIAGHREPAAPSTRDAAKRIAAPVVEAGAPVLIKNRTMFPTLPRGRDGLVGNKSL